MARPELAPGVPGKITTTVTPDGRLRAKARMRLFDYTRTDPTTGAYMPGPRVDVVVTVNRREDAERAIANAGRQRLARAKRQAQESRTVNEAEGNLTVLDLATRAVDALERSGEVVPSTIAAYRQHLRKHLTPSQLAAMPARAVEPGDVDDYLRLLAVTVGFGTAKHGRAVLTRGFDYGIRTRLQDGERLLAVNAVKHAPELRRPKNATAKAPHLDRERALTGDERAGLALAVARDERAKELDIRDAVLLTMAIGARIGELVALRWCDVGFSDDGVALVTLCGTVDRVAGRGLVRSRPKTASSVRSIPVARRTAALLRRRARVAGVNLADITIDERPVLPAPGRWSLQGESVEYWDRSNLSGHLRKLFDRCGYPWLSVHGLRRSAVTTLADVLPLRVAATFAGHASTRTTASYYLGRAKLDPSVADLL